MLAKKQTTAQLSFYNTFEEQLNHNHPLYILANKIDWKIFEEAFAKLYSDEGRPAKPIRLMVSLLMLKHIRNISDELYKHRWEIELFFKWIKQHLKIKSFWGHSENAVKTQVWIAVSAYV